MNRYESKIALLEAWSKRPSLKQNRSPTLFEADLLSLESNLGHSLPADYREFIRDYNGYIFFDPPLFPLQDSGGKKGGISSFFSIPDDLLNQYRNACESDWKLEDTIGLTLLRSVDKFQLLPYEQENSPWVLWPPEVLPIGTGGGSNYICLIIDGEQKGRVYYWQMNGSSIEQCIYLVSDSFDEFIQLL